MITEKDLSNFDRAAYARSVLRRVADTDVDDLVYNYREADGMSLLVCIAINLCKVLDDKEPVDDDLLETIEDDLTTLEAYGLVDCN